MGKKNIFKMAKPESNKSRLVHWKYEINDLKKKKFYV